MSVQMCLILLNVSLCFWTLKIQLTGTSNHTLILYLWWHHQLISHSIRLQIPRQLWSYIYSLIHRIGRRRRRNIGKFFPRPSRLKSVIIIKQVHLYLFVFVLVIVSQKKSENNCYWKQLTWDQKKQYIISHVAMCRKKLLVLKSGQSEKN